jgi:hypothetical protein
LQERLDAFVNQPASLHLLLRTYASVLKSDLPPRPTTNPSTTLTNNIVKQNTRLSQGDKMLNHAEQPLVGPPLNSHPENLLVYRLFIEAIRNVYEIMEKQPNYSDWKIPKPVFFRGKGLFDTFLFCKYIKTTVILIFSW